MRRYTRLLRCRSHVAPTLAILMICSVTGPARAQIAFDDVTFTVGIGVNATESFGASWGNFNGDAQRARRPNSKPAKV